MNNPSPLVPQGSMLEQKTKGRARLKTAFFCVLAIHIIPIMVALLLQGCRREQEEVPVSEPPIDTAYTPPAFDAPPRTETNIPDPNLATPYQVPPPPVHYPDTATPSLPPAAGQEHVVARGDTFSSLAIKYRVSIKAIQDANPGVDPMKLQIGQKLLIPAATATAAPAPGTSPTATAPTASGQVYIVKSGDTLTSIADKHGTTIRAIRNANNLKTDRIKVGDKLIIPPKAQ
jgi:LysM repeat protein